MAKTKILIVDDEEELVFTLAERLQFRGFDSDAVMNSMDAISHAQIKNYDVAVIDLKMPVVGGVQLMKMLKQIQPDIKIILMTGHCSEEVTQRSLAKGAYKCVIKPVRIDKLIEMIKQATSDKKQENDDEEA